MDRWSFILPPFCCSIQEFPSFPSPDFKTLPTSLQMANIRHADPVGWSLISREMKLAHTFDFKSKLMNKSASESWKTL
jgi:hypothetical protein